ncbi:MAG: hypothetical protein JSV88_10595 [Candidatus Aminicenantes bacterium]|nr:MAG: hypothetical protein JSV88_10595 [Candidatus Aminicenantes bacterium]
MMTLNRIHAQLTKEDENMAIQKLKEIESLLPFMVNLSTEERVTLPKMGKKTLDFVDRSLMYAKDHPNMVPPFMSVEAQQKDMELLKQIQRMLGVVEPLWEKLGDTYMLLGAEAYALARVFYNTVKSAAQAGVPGAESIAKDLGERFKKQFSNPDAETLE